MSFSDDNHVSARAVPPNPVSVGKTAAVVSLVRHELRVRLLRLAGVERPTPRFVRVILEGDELEGFVSLAPDDHIKLLLPGPGRRSFTPPIVCAGQVRWPAGPERPIARDYTPVRFDAGARRLVLELALHADGHAAQWAQRAEIGDIVGVAGPRGSHVLQIELEGLLLVGDETALPAIARWLGELPASTRVQAWIAVADAREQRALQTRAQASVHWIQRDAGAAGADGRLEHALAGASLPTPLSYAWIAGEAAMVQRVRKLLRARAVPDSRIRARGYWKHGIADHQEPHDD